MDLIDNKQKIQSKEVPSIWLLLQVLCPDSPTYFNPTAAPKYFIINTADIIEGDTSNSHAEGFVRFTVKEELTEGRVIYSAGSKESVEKKLQQLTPTLSVEEELKPKYRYFLVQYSNGPKDLIQSVVGEENVSWPCEIQPDQREVFIFDGGQKRLATVLCMHEDREYLNLEFQKLKQFCVEMAADESDQSTGVDYDDWILVLYTCGFGNVVYTILNSNDTFWREGNRYEDVISYIMKSRNVHQVVIIRKTSNSKELLNQLSLVKNTCISLDFPLEVDRSRDSTVSPLSFRSFCDSVQLLEEHSKGREFADIILDPNNLENYMKDDAAWIIEFEEVLENARCVLEKPQISITDVV